MFKSLFGKKDNNEPKKEVEKTSNINWIPLTSVEQITEVKEASKKGSVAVFKHSTRCIISRTVLQNFEEDYPSDIDLKLYFIDLLNYRDVSNAIAEQFGVIHQSPQFILIKNEKAVLNASHHGINEINLTESIN